MFSWFSISGFDTTIWDCEGTWGLEAIPLTSYNYDTCIDNIYSSISIFSGLNSSLNAFDTNNSVSALVCYLKKLWFLV